MSRSISDWQIEAELGRGAFGSVCRARRADGRVAALKIIDRGDRLALAQLRAEAAALAAIGAPSVPELYEDGSSSDQPYLALELIEEHTLEQLLRSTPLPAELAMGLGARLLEALVAVHARGFLSLDLKPSNMFAGLAPARVRLFDFGLARRIDGGASPVEQELLATAGTPEYQAPEQSAGAAVDGRADVYSAGVVLFELLAGRPPFSGAAGEVRQAHLGLRPQRPSRLSGRSIPELLEDVVLRALAKEPSQRFSSAAELRDAWRVAVQTIAAKAADERRKSSPGDVTSSRRAPVPATNPPIQRRSAGLVHFSAKLEPQLVQAEVEKAGAILANAAPPLYVALVVHERTDHPVRDALAVAQALCGRGLTERAIVDVAQVAVQRPGSANARFISSAFSQGAGWLDERAPLGALLSDAAAALLPEVSVAAVAGLSSLRRPLASSLTPADSTTPQLDRGPLVGRESVLSTLVSSARTAVNLRAPAIAVVTAEPGLGKSRLCTALRDSLSAALPAVQVLEVRTPEPVAGGPEALLRLLIDRMIDGGRAGESGRGKALLTDPLASGAQLLARLEELLLTVDGRANGVLAQELFPAVALSLGLYSHDAPELRTLAAAPGALRSLGLRAAGELLRAQARKRPLCLIVDDGHQADDTALDALEFAALAEAQVPLWICVLGRPAFHAARANFGERAAWSRHIALTALEPQAAEDLCRALLLPASNVPAEAVARLVQRTQGIPLLLVELVRGLKRDGLVRQSGPQTWVLETDQLDRLPDLPLVEWLAARELEALPLDLAAHAQLVALLGAEVVPAEVEGVIAELERSGAGAALPLDARVGMRRLRTAGILVSGAADTLRMRHNLVRDAVARAAPEELKRAVHDGAFRFYSDRSSAPEARRLPLLALHAAASGRKEPAAALYLELGTRAMARHSYLEAERASSRALELFAPGDKRRRLEALHARASMRYRIGRSDDALADFSAARALAQELGEAGAQLDLLLEEATALDWRNDFARSAALVAAANAIAAQTQATSAQHAGLAVGFGRTLFRKGDWASAAVQLERAVQLAEASGDASYETRVIALLLLQVVLPQLGRVEDGERVSEQVIALSRSRGDQLHLGSAINNRRNLLVARKALDACIADQLAFMRIGRELGMVISEYFGEINLGEMLFQSGDDQGAVAHIERAVAIEERHPEVAPRPFASLLRARALAARGELAQAQSGLARLRGSKATASSAGGSGAWSSSERVLIELLELATAAESIDPRKWDELVARSAQLSIEQEHLEVLELRARTALRAGRPEEAQRLLQAARDAALRIPNLYDARLSRLAEEIAQAAP